MDNKFGMITAIFSAMVLGIASQSSAGNLFQEGFEDGNLASRSWYDNTTPILSSVEHVANSTKWLQLYFSKGAVTPDNGTTMRKKFHIFKYFCAAIKSPHNASF